MPLLHVLLCIVRLPVAALHSMMLTPNCERKHLHCINCGMMCSPQMSMRTQGGAIT